MFVLPQQNKMKYTITIQNLKCGGCANTVRNTLEKIEVLKDITIEVDKSTVNFSSHDATIIPLVEKKLLEIGYPPVGSKNSVITKAKSFVSCATGKINPS